MCGGRLGAGQGQRKRIKANEAKPKAEAAGAAATAKSVGAVTLLGESAGLQSFFGGEITDPLEFNAWLSKQCGESSHLMMLGEVDGCHIVAEEQGEHEEPSVGRDKSQPYNASAQILFSLRRTADRLRCAAATSCLLYTSPSPRDS